MPASSSNSCGDDRASFQALLLAVVVAGMVAGSSDKELHPKLPIIFHVSAATEGLDGGAPGTGGENGSATAPFRTLQAAQAAVRALTMPARCRSGVTVLIQPGIYSIVGAEDYSEQQQPLMFGPSDGGCGAHAPVVYRATQPGTVHIDGGVRVPSSAFKRVAGKSYLRAPLPAGIPASGGFNRGWARNCTDNTRAELFFASATGMALQPMVEARHPNTGPDGNCRWMRQGAVLNSTTFEAGQEQGMPINTSLWAGAHSLWVHGFWHYDWADTYERVVQLSPPGAVVIEGQASNDWTYTIDRAPHYGLSVGSRYYVTGALALLDAPGEYLISNSSVYLYPPTSSLHADAEVVISAASTLVVLNNTAHLHFVGLSMGVSRDRTVCIAGSTNISFTACNFSNAGGIAVLIDDSRVKIAGSHVWGSGCTGISMQNVGDITTLTPGQVELSSNKIYDFARVYRTVQPGIKWERVVGAQVRDNEISHAPHVGIIGARGNDNIFEGNYLHDLCRGTSDAGAF
jgi:hypothetical protein|eukprot:SAG25_NODE_309_length_10042_cov_25.194609_2_plen_515_part_00